MKVGLEIHVTLNTKSKLFCTCSTTNALPNTNVCEVCLGFPGSKPTVNKEAVRQCTLLARALNFTVKNNLVFSRKSYFYPDLSKNYQITQFEEPLGVNGSIIADGNIRLKRIHLEEDPAQIIRNNKTLIDYNRSGMPLAEIVTEPDIKSAEQARLFMNKLSRILKYLNITDNVKADVNVSIKESGYSRCEIKNVTGFKDIERAIISEAKRQKKAVENNEKIQNATYGWDPLKQKTYVMRLKESEADYGYIYDPDLPIIKIPTQFLKEKLPELSDEKIARYTKQGVPLSDADIIAQDKDIAELFEQINLDPVFKAKWFRREILRVLNYNNQTILQSKFTKENVSKVLNLVYDNKINEAVGKKLLEKLVVEDFDVEKHVKEHDLLKIDDSDLIKKVTAEVLKNNNSAVNDYLSGEQKALNFLFGLVMRQTKGKADPGIIRENLQAELDKLKSK